MRKGQTTSCNIPIQMYDTIYFQYFRFLYATQSLCFDGGRTLVFFNCFFVLLILLRIHVDGMCYWLQYNYRGGISVSNFCLDGTRPHPVQMLRLLVWGRRLFVKTSRGEPSVSRIDNICGFRWTTVPTVVIDVSKLSVPASSSVRFIYRSGRRHGTPYETRHERPVTRTRLGRINNCDTVSKKKNLKNLSSSICL